MPGSLVGLPFLLGFGPTIFLLLNQFFFIARPTCCPSLVTVGPEMVKGEALLGDRQPPMKGKPLRDAFVHVACAELLVNAQAANTNRPASRRPAGFL